MCVWECVRVFATMLHPCTATQTTREKKAPAAADPYQNKSTGVLPSSAETVQKTKSLNLTSHAL